MAKIEEDEPADTGGWINTFADLMNLLLCFFVLLFSMSTVDAQKYEAVVKSMSESINIFDGGGESMGQGPFIDSGTDQVVAISQYFNECESSGEDADATEDQSNQQPGESASEQGEHSDEGGQKSDDGQNKSDDTQAHDNADQQSQNQGQNTNEGETAEQQDQNAGQDTNQGQNSQDQNQGQDTNQGQNQDQNQDGQSQDQNQGGQQQDTETGNQGQQQDQNPQSHNDDNKTGDNIDRATVEAVEAQQEAEQKKRNEETYEEIMKAAEDRNLEDDISVQMDKKNQYVQITMNGALLFDSGQAEVKDSAKPLLSRLGNILKLYKGNRIQILGHTDAVPMSSAQFPNNLWLSMARATSVFEYMTEVKKLNPHNIETTGRGEYDPVATNATEEGRARNRRVEFRIYTNK